MATIVNHVVWHSHDERPVYIPGGDNRLVTCLNMQRMDLGAMDGMNFCYVELNPDGSTNNCGDIWHSEKWLKKAAVKWEHHCKDTWWAYVRDLIPEGI